VTWSLTEPAATVWAHDVRRAGEGQVFTAYWKAGNGLRHGRAEIKLPYWGDHHRANALMAVATGWALGLAPEPRIELRPDNLPGRARQLDVAGVLVTDDAYNANPESMRAALKAFAELPAKGRRVAVLGDMAELGDFGPAAHEAVGAYAAELGLDEVVGIGELAAGYCAGVAGKAACHHFTTIEAAVDHLVPRLDQGDRVLLKASRAGRFETVIERLAVRLEGGRA
jgi:UDP-N-acetylmuramoyl-tripeptide--D-alanyl-D-alanine ligase